MFQYLIELLLQFWERLCPWVVLPQYDAGLVLRMGIYHRTLTPGWSWKWPFIEEVLSTTTVITTEPLRPQTLTTADGVGVVTAAILKYEVRDVVPYLLEIWDRTDVLSDVALGAIRAEVQSHSYEQLIKEGIEAAVLKTVRAQVNRYGFKVHNVTFTDIGKVRSLRLITSSDAFSYGGDDS